MAARRCVQPVTAMQTMYDWAQQIVQASARCFSSEDGDQHVVWETLVPRYCSSTVPALEARRENLAIALAGQLSVFFCRFLSGHWGASGVGLVFVVGNNARCSLQVSELTCYLALAGGAGALDVLDLLQHLVAGTIAVHLPFADHLALNLQAFGLLMAPCCEFYGSHIAYGCYLSPAMLFERDERMMMDPRQSMMDPRQSQMMSLYAYPHAAAFHSLPPRLPDPMRTRMPPDAGWGDHVASMIPGWPGWQDVQAYMPGWAAAGAYQNQVDALASSSQEQPHASMKRRSNSVDVACAECGATIRPGQGRCGTGDFFGCVYCSNCWSVWGSQSSS